MHVTPPLELIWCKLYNPLFTRLSCCTGQEGHMKLFLVRIAQLLLAILTPLFLIVFFLLLLTACGSDTSKSVTFTPAAESEEGITVFVHSGEPEYDIQQLNTWWIETKQCLQLEAEPPIIQYANDMREICDSSTGAVGVHCNNGDGWFIGMTSSWAHVRHEMKHEMIHSIHSQNGLTDHQKHDFGNDTFWQCQWN